MVLSAIVGLSLDAPMMPAGMPSSSIASENDPGRIAQREQAFTASHRRVGRVLTRYVGDTHCR